MSSNKEAKPENEQWRKIINTKFSSTKAYVSFMQNTLKLEMKSKKSLELELASTKKMLDEALKIINMVQDNRKMPHKHLDYFERLCCLSERATEFLAKHEKKEGYDRK